MDFRIGTGGISYTNVSQTKQDKKVERQSFQGSLEKVIQNQKMTQPQDSIEFSEESDFKKLEKLKELNDATDFSGMTDVEKFEIIEERYRKAFPDFNARMHIGYDIDINEKIFEQRSEDIKKAGINEKKLETLYRAYKGYDKMTDEQKWESIQKEYGNPQNGIEQVCALTEMALAGLIDRDTFYFITHQIKYKTEVAGATEHGRNYKIYGTEVGSQYGYEYLQNNKIDFNSVKEEAMTSITLRADFGDINEQIQRKQQLGYEMDYIVDLMNALEGRKD